LRNIQSSTTEELKMREDKSESFGMWFAPVAVAIITIILLLLMQEILLILP